MKGKHYLIGLAVLAVVTVAYFAFDGTTSSDHVRGTIGSPDSTVAGVEQAQRYRAKQMSDDDVELGGADLARMLQNETIVMLIENPNFAKAIREPEVRRAIEDIAEAYETRGPDGSNEIPLGGDATDVPLGGDSYEIPIEPVDLDEVFDDEHVRYALENDDMRDALWDEYIQNLMSSDEWQRLNEVDVEEIFSSGEAVEDRTKTRGDEGIEREAIKNDGLPEFADDVEFRKAVIMNKALFEKASQDEGFRKALHEKSADLQKMTQLFNKSLFEKATLRKAIYEKTAAFEKAVLLSKSVPEFEKALAFSKTEFEKAPVMWKAVFEKTADFHKMEFGQ